jgi:hypothetical protein
MSSATDSDATAYSLPVAVSRALAEHERTDAVRIAECDHAVAEHHRHDRVTADTTRMRAGDRFENMIRRQRAAILDLQLVREHVEQHFGIGIGVDVAAIVLEHLAAQRLGVDQVAVVRERDAERRVHVQRLRLGGTFGTGGRITAMTDADAAAQRQHAVAIEHVAHEAAALVQAQAVAVDGGDAGGVLAAVLQDGERVVERRSDFRLADDADDSAHDDGYFRWMRISEPAPAFPVPATRV